MPDIKNINILDAITEHKDFHTSIFLTYGTNLAFYEQAILSQLWPSYCRNNLIFMDAERYADTTVDYRDTIGYVGRRYLIIPVSLGYLQSFHIKLIFLLGSDRARLLIGSGNLTFNGYGDNFEIFTQIDWSISNPNYQYLFVQAWLLVKEVQKRWGHSNQVTRMIQKAEAQTDWLHEKCKVGELLFFHSLDIPLLDQLSAVLEKRQVKRFTIQSPFFDKNSQAIKEIYTRFRPQNIDIVIQNGQTVGNSESFSQLQTAKYPLSFYGFKQTRRYAHAKLYVVETAQETYLAAGSANCTNNGLLSTSVHGNVEALVIKKYKTNDRTIRLLHEHINTQPVTDLSQFEIKPHAPIAPRARSFIQLLDISIEGEQISVKFELKTLPREVNRLELIIPFPRKITFTRIPRHQG